MTMYPHPITKRRLSEWDLKRLFNEGGLIKEIRRGVFRAESKRCSPVLPSNPRIGRTIPIGSISQTLHFYDDQERKALELQRYIKPDGELGASGKNDPKELLIENVLYHREQPSNPHPRLKNKEINAIHKKSSLPAVITYLK